MIGNFAEKNFAHGNFALEIFASGNVHCEISLRGIFAGVIFLPLEIFTARKFGHVEHAA